MGKFDTLIAEMLAEQARLRKEADGMEPLIQQAIRLNGGVPKQGTNAAQSHVSESGWKGDPSKAGGKAHIHHLMNELRSSKTMRPKTYFVQEAMKVASPGITEKHMMQRVINSLQSLRETTVANHKPDGTNQSAVWGPIDAFDKDGNPLPEWKW